MGLSMCTSTHCLLLFVRLFLVFFSISICSYHSLLLSFYVSCATDPQNEPPL